jgi:hypothetical protein
MSRRTRTASLSATATSTRRTISPAAVCRRRRLSGPVDVAPDTDVTPYDMNVGLAFDLSYGPRGAPRCRRGEGQSATVPHGGCAKAVGAATAQISGETDQVYRDLSRADAIARRDLVRSGWWRRPP